MADQPDLASAHVGENPVAAIGAKDADTAGPHSGAVFIYQVGDSFIPLMATLTASDAHQFETLGSSVALSGDTVVAGNYVDVKPGNVMPLGNMPVGTIVHNVELKIGKGGQLARSAGTYAQVVGRDQDYVIVRLNSGEQRLVHGRCTGTIGAVSNPDEMNTTIGKAGRQRWKGRRPHNRGISMNPVDHPHGGRTNGGVHPSTPWGFPTKGKKSRKNKSTNKFIMLSRHARKKQT